MSRWKMLLALILACVCCVSNAPAQALNEEWVKNITDALDSVKPDVQPLKPHKVLVFNLCNGFPHSSVPYGAKMLEIMGQKTGAFETVLSDDIAMFEPANLAQFDAVVMNNTTGELFLPKNLGELSPEQQQAARERDAVLKQSLLDFVKSGKGIMGIHAATDCFYEWPDYGEMMGGYFDGHPWSEDVGVKLDDPAHPLLKAFKGRGFTIGDEIYQFRDPYSREKLRVLMSLDTSKTNMNKGDAVHRKDGDFAVAWIHSYGQGRVFYCSLGHREEIFWNKAVLQHYLDGLQFALGELPADATPSAQLPPQYLEESTKELDATFRADVLKDVAAYEFGKPREALSIIQEDVLNAANAPEKRDALAKQLLSVLTTNATLDAKQFICEQLSMIGSAESIPALAGMLTNKDTSAMARYALQRISDASAEAALRDALAQTSGDMLVGVVNSLGERALIYPTAPETTVALAHQLIGQSDLAVAKAAAAALGKIGNAEAADVLLKAKDGVSADLRPVLADAALLCADKLSAQGDAVKACAIYETFVAPSEARNVRYAAVEGLMAALGEKAAPRAIEILAADDLQLQRVAAKAVRTIPGAPATTALAEALPKLPVSAQSLLLYALADRGDVAALAGVTQMATSEDAAVRVAALNAVTALGNAGSVPVLAKAAAAGQPAEQDVARQGLAQLRGNDIDAAIVAELASSDVPARVELIRALAARNATAAVPTLLECAKDADESVCVAAFDSLAVLAAESDLAALVDRVVNVAGTYPKEDLRVGAAGMALDSVASKSAAGGQRVAPILAALSTVNKPEAKCFLLLSLGHIGDKAGLPALVASTKESNEVVRGVAMMSLSQWPTSDPLDDLIALAETEPEAELRVAALRGCLRMMALGSTQGAQERVELYKRCLVLGKNTDEKKIVVEALGAIGDVEAIPLLQLCLDDQPLTDLAKASLEKLKAVGLKGDASNNAGETAKAFDGDAATRWTSGAPMKEGMWFMLDFGFPREVSHVILDAAGSPNDFPRGYEVYVTNDKANPGVAVAKGEGKGPQVDIAFTPVVGRYVKIVQTGSAPSWYWSIHELKVE